MKILRINLPSREDLKKQTRRLIPLCFEGSGLVFFASLGSTINLLLYEVSASASLPDLDLLKFERIGLNISYGGGAEPMFDLSVVDPNHRCVISSVISYTTQTYTIQYPDGFEILGYDLMLLSIPGLRQVEERKAVL